MRGLTMGMTADLARGSFVLFLIACQGNTHTLFSAPERQRQQMRVIVGIWTMLPNDPQ